VVATEPGLLAAVLAGLLVGYIGLAVLVSGAHRVWGGVVLLLGLWCLLRAPVTHDRCHLTRGEPAHAVWGRGDRRKPSWWPPLGRW
jgi:hypothetical protein